MQRINEHLTIEGAGEAAVIRCRCGYSIRPITDNYKMHVLMRERPVQEAGPWVDPLHIGGDAFVCREFYCPGCVTLLDVEISQRGEPILWDVRIDASPSVAAEGAPQ